MRGSGNHSQACCGRFSKCDITVTVRKRAEETVNRLWLELLCASLLVNSSIRLGSKLLLCTYETSDISKQ